MKLFCPGKKHKSIVPTEKTYIIVWSSVLYKYIFCVKKNLLFIKFTL